MVRISQFAALHSRKILLSIVAAVVGYLVLPPIVMLLFSSVRATAGKLPFEATTFTLANLVEVFSSEITYRVLLNTGWYTFGTVALGLGMATAFAWFLERTNVPLRRIMFVMVLAPAGMPMIIMSMAWILVANPANGILNVVLRDLLGMKGPGPLNIYSVPGMIVLTALQFVPLMYIMISGVFSRMDPSLEEAARTSGGGTWATFRRVSLPLLGPALLATAIFFAIRGMEIFEIPAMLGRPRRIYVFSTLIYFAIYPLSGDPLPHYGLASTYGLVLLAVAGVLIYLYGRYTRNAERFATVTGRGYRPRLISLGRWKFVPVILMGGYFTLTIAIPLAILMWTSLAPPYTTISLSTLPKLNLGAYRQMVMYPFLVTAAKNTFIIATALGVLGMLISTLVSWLSVRGGIRGASLPDRISFVVMGVPGVVLGLALIFIYAPLPLPIYATIWIIVVAFVTTSLPFGTRLMGAAFLQIHKELEEAAATSGASMGRTFFRVVLPLLWPSVARGFLFMFVRGMRDATIPLMLYAVGNQTLSVTLWSLWMGEGRFALASAIAVPMMVATVLLSYLVARRGMLTKGGA